ncbi:MAG: CPBP family intramembrane metalloprotease [Lachnospiraceae bacterium]|nr:CPBP family intramembrane metalloprotease [Lachnospiraceae bacterium]
MSPKYAYRSFIFIMAVLLIGRQVYSLVCLALPFMADTIPVLLSSQLMVILPVVACACLTPASFREMFPVRRIRVSSLLLTILATVLIYPAVMVINLITLLVTTNRAVEIGAVAMELPVWQSVLLIGIIGPAFEELTFRGYLYQNLSAKGRTVAACFISALFFGIAHGNLNQACYAFFFGVFLAFLARATGSVTAGFFSHALFNSLEVLFMYSIDRTALTQTQQGLSLIDILQAQGVSGTMWVSLILALIVFAGFAALLSALAFFLITRIRKIESAAAS